jgi:ribosome maturation factor RimP
LSLSQSHIEEVGMSASSQSDAVRALAEPLAAESGLVVESVTVTPAGKRRVLRVTVDLPETEFGGVPMESVATAAQAISAALDAGTVMGGQPYVLEVSSPGADRPLTERRHWLRARRRLVRTVAAAGASPQTGRLTGVTDAGIVLDDEREVPWEQIAGGRIELEFGHPDDFADLDEDDEDDEDDEPDDEEDLDEDEEERS